jgi:F-type H+-transporting ATPase subunit beta
VSEEVLRRIFNVTGDPVDNMGEGETDKNYAIYGPAPTLFQGDTGSQIVETDIKIIDLIYPLIKGARSGHSAVLSEGNIWLSCN